MMYPMVKKQRQRGPKWGYWKSEIKPEPLDQETIRKINDELEARERETTRFFEGKEMTLKDWQWEIMLQNESNNEDWD